jgi:murein L,D-transpeptidase YcbB/YkuD
MAATSTCTAPSRAGGGRATAAVAAAGLLLAVGCRPAEPVARPAGSAPAVTEHFATAEPYSPRRLGDGDLAAFLAAHPAHAADSAELAAFYARREGQYAWIVADALAESAEAFVALAGLGAGPADSLDFACAPCVRDAELSLTAAFLRHVRRDYGGHVTRDPRELQWFIPRAKKDYARLLDALATGTPDLAAYAPVHPLYRQLQAAIVPWQALAGAPWDTLVLPRGVRRVAPGDSSPLVPPVRARLAQLGDHAAPAGPSPWHDSVLVDAVRRFQRRHGLIEDGVIGTGVLRQLNVPPAARLRTLLVNMERLRWVPAQPPATAIVVNIPEFRLRVLEAGAEVLAMPIVVGATATRSVVFADSVTSVTFSPTWTVPASIVRKEILPVLRRDPGYLARNRMDIIGGTDALPEIRQRPGPHNALGLVKFSFPNRFGIFMHDTPSRGLFAREQRAFSHGCIRLAEPQALAAYLLRSDTTWTAARMRAAMARPVEQVVPLRTPVPVFLVYFTAWVDGDGRLNFRDDVYGHDARLAAELFAGAT